MEVALILCVILLVMVTYKLWLANEKRVSDRAQQAVLQAQAEAENSTARERLVSEMHERLRNEQAVLQAQAEAFRVSCAQQERDRGEEALLRWRTQELDAAKALILRDVETQNAVWVATTTEKIRADSIKQSLAVTTGKVAEQLVPFFPTFPWSPKDARFIGSPIDLVVFDWVDENTLREIIFVEVKAGASARLTTKQRQLRDCVQAGRVTWRELRPLDPATALKEF